MNRRSITHALLALASLAAIVARGSPATAQQASAYVQGQLTQGHAVQSCGPYCLQDGGGAAATTGANSYTGAQTAPSFIPNGSTAPSLGMYAPSGGGTGLAGHVTSYGAAPALASGGGDCGTSPAIAGNDDNGRVTVGSSTNGGKCTLTFGSAWNHTPQCTVQDEVTTNLMRPVATTTTLAITGTLTAGDTLVYRCSDFN